MELWSYDLRTANRTDNHASSELHPSISRPILAITRASIGERADDGQCSRFSTAGIAALAADLHPNGPPLRVRFAIFSPSAGRALALSRCPLGSAHHGPPPSLQ